MAYPSEKQRLFFSLQTWQKPASDPLTASFPLTWRVCSLLLNVPSFVSGTCSLGRLQEAVLILPHGARSAVRGQCGRGARPGRAPG